MEKQHMPIEQFGLWWGYVLPKSVSDNLPVIMGMKKDRLLISRTVSIMEGFSKEEASELVQQVLDDSISSFMAGRSGFKKVKLGCQQIYVLISSTGSIELPQGTNRQYLRTLDSSLIPGFDSCINYNE
jgi:hypothetical protein